MTAACDACHRMSSQLPPVPNIIGIASWILAGFGSQEWQRCKFNVWCRLKNRPPLSVLPPPRVLPPLSEVEGEESQARYLYWGAFLLVSPVLMALICEVTRCLFRVAKILGSKASGYLSGTSTLEPTDNNTGRLLMLDITADRQQIDHPFTGDAPCLTLKIVLYHLACAGIVGVAVQHDWISPRGLGSFSWELWALWQQMCLWNLFGQNLARCLVLDAEGLKASTMKVIVLYTAPFVSELCDTMKDWVVAGFCYLEATGRWGYISCATGVGMVALEITCIAYGYIPQFARLRVTDQISVTPPMMLLLGLYAGMAASVLIDTFGLLIVDAVFANVKFGLFAFIVVPMTAACYMIFTMVTCAFLSFQGIICAAGWLAAAILDIFACLWLRDLGRVKSFIHSEQQFLGGSVCNFAWYTPAQWFNATDTGLRSNALSHRTDVGQMYRGQVSSQSWFRDAYMYVTDGGILCIISIYVIIYSYTQVIVHEDCARDIRKTYRGILELPSKPAQPGAGGWSAWLQREAENVLVDMLSSSRLMIAWAEDIPQGLLSVVLLARFTQHGVVQGLGLAGLSAMISLSKGVCTPTFQPIMRQRQRRNVGRELKQLLELDENLEDLAKQLSFRMSNIIEREHLTRLSLSMLKERSDDVLARYNVGQREAYQPIFSDRDQWFSGLSQDIPEDTQKMGKIAGFLVAVYLDEGKIAPGDLLGLGYCEIEVTSGCRHAGFSISQIRELGFVFEVGQCRDAGFSCQECLEAGHTVKDCKDGGYSCQEFRLAGILPSIDNCLDAGFSFKEVGEAFTVVEFYNDQRIAKECLRAGFTLQQCQQAGYSNRVLERAGFEGATAEEEVANILNFNDF